MRVRIANSIYQVRPIRGSKDRVTIQRLLVCSPFRPWPGMEDAPAFPIDWPIKLGAASKEKVVVLK